MSEIRYNPFDPDVLGDPYPYYARLRREAPVHRMDELNWLAVSRYDDAAALLRRADLFSSAPYRHFIDAALAAGGRAGALPGESLLGSDPPTHTRLRKVVNRGFTRQRVMAAEPRIRQIATELVDAFAERGECELIEEFAMPIPVMIIAEILGIDSARRADFKRWSDDLILAVTGGATAGRDADSLARSLDALDAYVAEVVEERRRRPTDDLVSALIAAEGQEEVMTAAEVNNFIQLLLVAGNEATTYLIANTVLAMLDHPVVHEAVRKDPTLIPAVVEETLRYDAPVQLTLREAVADTEIANTPVAKGETIAVLIGSANRDEAAFRAADRFDPGRERGGYLTYGIGPHYCLGAHLALLEGTIALQALLSRVTAIERVAGPIERPQSFLVRGPKTLRIRFEPLNS
jgi:cytochrome P450